MIHFSNDLTLLIITLSLSPLGLITIHSLVKPRYFATQVHLLTTQQQKKKKKGVLPLCLPCSFFQWPRLLSQEEKRKKNLIVAVGPGGGGKYPKHT